MSIPSRTAATAGLLALPLGVTACGGGGSSVSVTTTTATTSATSSATPSSTTPSTPSSTSTSSSTASTPSSTLSSSTSNAKKPTKAAATAGLAKALGATTKGASLKPSVVQKISSCIVDKTYNTLSASALQAFVSGDQNARLNAKDNAAYLAATTACGKQLGLRK